MSDCVIGSSARIQVSYLDDVQNHLREQVYAGAPLFTRVSSNTHLCLRCRAFLRGDPPHYEQAAHARRSGPAGWIQTSGRRATERRSSTLPGGGLASVSSERPRRLAQKLTDCCYPYLLF